MIHCQAILKVLCLSKYLLLQTASPDGIIRLERTSLSEEAANVMETYFKQQYHHSIGEFLNSNVHNKASYSGLLIQVRYYSY